MKLRRIPRLKSVFVAAFALAAFSGFAELKIGIIGLDTSHSLCFTEIINVKKADFAAAQTVGRLEKGARYE